MNCPNCGAVIKEGKFCNYCGAKLPDDTKRVEVKIDKRIEDVAEIKRADYETEESKLKQRQMKAEFAGRKIRRWSCLILLVICVIVSAIFLAWSGPVPAFVGLFGTSLLVTGFFLICYIVYLLVTGKW